MFQDQDSARSYLEARRWPNGACCPVCGLTERITVRKNGYYRCNRCKEDFTVRTGTILERSHVPLHQWLHALLITSRKGISSVRLSKEIGVTQKTAWFMLQRLSEVGNIAGLGMRERGGRAIAKPIDEADVIADRVLAYRPKPKSKPAKKRARQAKKAQREPSI